MTAALVSTLPTFSGVIYRYDYYDGRLAEAKIAFDFHRMGFNAKTGAKIWFWGVIFNRCHKIDTKNGAYRRNPYKHWSG
jgi:hypothetical protein